MRLFNQITIFSGENMCADQIVMDFASCMFKTPHYLYQTHQGTWTSPELSEARDFWNLRHTMHHINCNVTSGIPERQNQGIYIRYLNENHFEPMHAGLMAI